MQVQWLFSAPAAETDGVVVSCQSARHAAGVGSRSQLHDGLAIFNRCDAAQGLQCAAVEPACALFSLPLEAGGHQVIKARLYAV